MEKAAAAGSLEEQARGLMQAVGMFKLAEGGGSQRMAAAAVKTPRLAAPAKHPAPPQAKPKKIASPLAGDPEDEWEQF